jgi:hypothetical protein
VLHLVVKIPEEAYGIAVQAFEQINSLLEEIDNFFLRRISCVATCLESTNTGTVFWPFMLPEALIITVDIDPISVHISEEISLAIWLENSGNVCVCARRITAGIIGTITVIWPETVNSPRVGRTGAGRRVPELGLKELTAWGVEAAGIRNGSGILAGNLGVGAGKWGACEHHHW